MAVSPDTPTFEPEVYSASGGAFIDLEDFRQQFAPSRVFDGTLICAGTFESSAFFLAWLYDYLFAASRVRSKDAAPFDQMGFWERNDEPKPKYADICEEKRIAYEVFLREPPQQSTKRCRQDSI